MRLVSLTLVVFCGFGFIRPSPKKFVPPGTARINDSLFADKAEVSNFAWREYEYSVKTKFGSGSPEHLATLPDTSVWLKGEQPNSVFYRSYYRSSIYKDHPVVGISYEQASAFCLWRTEMVKMVYSVLYHKGLKLNYRLPQKAEWEMLAYQDSWRIKDSSAALLKGSSTGPNKIYTYQKNPYGLYNLIGNVAEMTSNKGCAKGGSWRHEAESARTGKDLPYSGPENWLGFRCVSILYKP